MKASVRISALSLVAALSFHAGKTWNHPSAVESLMGATVRIEDKDSFGTGTVIASKWHKDHYETYILTNYHVVRQALTADKEADKKITATSFRYIGNKKVAEQVDEVTVVKQDDKADLVLLKYVRGDRFPVVARLAARNPEPLTKVTEIGCPIGVDPFVTQGIVTDIDDEGIRESAATFSGNSGGSLYNDQNELIGVPYEVMYSGGMMGRVLIPHLAAAIPISKVHAFLKGSPV